MSLNLIFLGPPGAGKGTVAQAVSDKYKLKQVSTGDLIRAEVTSGSKFGEELSKIMASGGLVNDEQVGRMLENELSRIFREKKFNGIILDGFPRTLPQADQLNNILARLGERLTAVIYLDADKDSVVERISSRYCCPKCKRVYNTISLKPRKVGVCDDDGEKLTQREDDKAETVAKRFDVFLEKTMPLKKYYEEKGLLKSYDTNVPVDESISRAEKIIAQIVGN